MVLSWNGDFDDGLRPKPGGQRNQRKPRSPRRDLSWLFSPKFVPPQEQEPRYDHAKRLAPPKDLTISLGRLIQLPGDVSLESEGFGAIIELDLWQLNHFV